MQKCHNMHPTLNETQLKFGKPNNTTNSIHHHLHCLVPPSLCNANKKENLNLLLSMHGSNSILSSRTPMSLLLHPSPIAWICREIHSCEWSEVGLFQRRGRRWRRWCEHWNKTSRRRVTCPSFSCPSEGGMPRASASRVPASWRLPPPLPRRRNRRRPAEVKAPPLSTMTPRGWRRSWIKWSEMPRKLERS